MSTTVPDMSEYIRIKKVQVATTVNDSLTERKRRSIIPYSLSGASLRLRRLPVNALVPLKIAAPALVPVPTPPGPTITNPPATVTFTSLANFSLSATWSLVSGATSYTLRVYESSSSTVTLQNSTVIYTFENATSGSSFSLVNSYDTTKYLAVGVTATGPNGTSSVSLSSSRVSLPTAPPIVTLTKPVSDGMVVTWAGAARADSYRVQVYTGTSSSLTTSSTLVGTFNNATSGNKLSFTPVDGNFYAVTITSINATGEVTGDILAGSYVRYVLTNTADYNYQFRVGNIQPTTLYGATAYDTGNANSWVIRLRKIDYDGDTLTSVLTTALGTAGTLVLSNIANANQKLTFTVSNFIVNASDHFEIVGTKDLVNSTSLTDDTIVKVTITEAENPPIEYVFSVSTSPPNPATLVNNPGSGNIIFQPVMGNAKINLAISKTNKAGVDVSTWHTDNGTIGKTFRLRLVSDPTLLNFTAVIENRVDRTTHWEYNLAAPTSQAPPAGQQPSVTFPADANIALI